MKARLYLLLIGITIVSVASAQPKNLAKFFPLAAVNNSSTAGQANLHYIINGYVGPLAEDLGGVASGGWYNTAENHKRFGFDLCVNMTTIFAPSSSQAFPVDNAQLSEVGFLGTTTGSGQMATAYGAELDEPTFSYNGGPNFPATPVFSGPGGGNLVKEIPIGSMAIPTIQAGLGLFANTDLRFRFTPGIAIGETKVDMWGAGLMHDIKQHIAGLKELPFSLSLMLAYTNLKTATNMGGLYQNTAGNNAGQEGVAETTAFTAQVLISKQIPVLTFYGGIGYNSGNTTFKINGNYVVDSAYLPAGGTDTLDTPVTLNDPFSNEYSTSGFRFTGGIRFKFGPIFLNSDYTFYKGAGLLTLGFGATVR